VAACQLACRLKPNDMTLTTRLKNLSAEKTIQGGQYETAESFKGSLNNAKKQMDAQQDINLVNQDAVVERQLNDARRELSINPTQAGKIFALADALCRRGRPEDIKEAASVLEKGYATTGSYRFRERRDDITLKELHQRAQAAVAEAKTDPNNKELLEAATRVVKDFRDSDERIYADRVQNYPTDLTLKFEFGRRLFINGKYDAAIAQFQAAESDAKNRLRALSLLGQSFFRLEFFQEAVDTYRRAISQVEMNGGETAKELHYNLGLALEHMGKLEDADAAFSKVVQWDFTYRDTRQRIQKLRQQRKDKDNKDKDNPAESAG
jgi:tetratricopeptide (TPR) repeat protein